MCSSRNHSSAVSLSARRGVEPQRHIFRTGSGNLPKSAAAQKREKKIAIKKG
jgi:hypothetical protein